MNKQLLQTPVMSHAHCIRAPYAIFESTPIYKTTDGQFWFPVGMAKHLSNMTVYIVDLILCCPVKYVETIPAGTVSKKSVAALGAIEIMPLKYHSSIVKRAIGVIPDILKMQKTLAKAEIIETSASRPISLVSKWLFFMPKSLRQKWVVDMDYSFIAFKHSPTFKRRSLRNMLAKADMIMFNDIRLFESLGDRSQKSAFVPVSWVEEATCLTQDHAAHLVAEKQARKALHLLYASPLEEVEGIDILLEAVEILQTQDIQVHIDIMGAGSWTSTVDRFVDKLGNANASDEAITTGNITLKRIPQQPDGASYFAAIRMADAIVLPKKGVSPARIIFDAYSQSVPVLSSKISILRGLVHTDSTGYFVPHNTPEQWAEHISLLAQHKDSLASLSMNALRYAKSRSHYKVHAKRAALMSELL